MAIENNQIVSLNYALYDVSEENKPVLLETTSGQVAQEIWLGHYQGFASVEKAIIGREKGDQFVVQLSPEEGYGERREDAVQRVPLKHLLSKEKPRKGSVVKINAKGGEVNATVVKVGHYNVDVDTNHPLAGRTLKFEIQVVDVRDASEEELSSSSKT